MSNPEHIELVLKGEEAIENWKKEHTGEVLNLARADLRMANISGIDLSDADLSHANLLGVSLDNTNLSNANLNSAILVNTKSHYTNFTGADLSRAVCVNAHFQEADFQEATLIEADLFSTDFFLVDLSRANLTNALLEEASFRDVNFSGADLSGARFYKTTIAESIFVRCNGLETIRHDGPSSISIDSIAKTFRGERNRLAADFMAFCINLGVPKEVLAILPGALSEVEYYTCFVGYGGPDEAFAERLVIDLRERGVSCWIYSLDKIPGERTWREIGKKRREADKMIIICSVNSLLRDGVLKEIEEQIDEDPEKIILISLDDIWRQRGFRVMRGERDLKPFLMARNYADFSDESKYKESLEELLTGVRRRD